MLKKFHINAFSLILLTSCASAPKEQHFSVKPEHVKVGSNLAVSSDGAYTAKIVEEIHKLGGNWADVFVAASFALSVERPQSTGIGGGGFALIHVAKESKTYAFDFREAAPEQLAKKYKELFSADGKRNTDLSSKSLRGSGVPGTVLALEQIHKKWGKLKWEQVITPSIKLAEEGFKVDRLLAQAISLANAKIIADPNMKAVYYNGETPLKEGDTVVQKDLAQTLKTIAKSGSKEFYRGSITKQIVDFNKKSGGYLAAKDFSKYKVIERKPLTWTQGNFEFIAFPFPSFGGEATYMIQNNSNLHKEQNEESLTQEWVATLTKTFEERAKKFEGATNKPETTHISIVDAEGNTVSSTQTVNSTFGSGKMVPGAGIIMNDEMDDFYYENAKAKNHPLQTPRPLSSMAPTIVLQNGKVKLATGSQGGRRLMSCVNWVLLHKLWLNKSLEEAVSSSRIHLSYPQKELVVDVGTPNTWLKNLSDYKITNPPVDCRVQSVEVDEATKTLKSVVDPRSTGTPVAI